MGAVRSEYNFGQTLKFPPISVDAEVTWRKRKSLNMSLFSPPSTASLTGSPLLVYLKKKTGSHCLSSLHVTASEPAGTMMEPGRAVVRETEPDFEGDLNKAAAGLESNNKPSYLRSIYST